MQLQVRVGGVEGGEGRVRDNLLNGMTCVAGGATSTTRGVERFAVSTSDEMTTAGWGTPLVILKRWTARRLALTMRDRESFAVRQPSHSLTLFFYAWARRQCGVARDRGETDRLPSRVVITDIEREWMMLGHVVFRCVFDRPWLTAAPVPHTSVYFLPPEADRGIRSMAVPVVWCRRCPWTGARCQVPPRSCCGRSHARPRRKRDRARDSGAVGGARGASRRR